MRGLSLVVLLTVGGCGGANPPTGFGVNLTLSLSSAVRPLVRTVTIHVTGAETYDVPALPISVFPDGTAHVHYIPGVRSGDLAFAATGFSSDSAKVAFGASDTVTLASGRAISATISLDSASTDDMAAADLAADDGSAGDLSTGSADLVLDHQPSYDFGTVLVNTQSAAATLTVTNKGGVVSSPLGAAALSGSGASAFSVQTDNCAQGTLAPNASCTIVVVLGPTTAGTPTATLTIGANDGGTATVMLYGAVVTPGAISVSATPSASPTVVLPSGTATLNVTVSNSGGVATGPITWGFTGNASGDYTVIGGTCTPSQTLSPSSSCALSVKFAPTTSGARNATLTIAATPGGPGVLQLTGTALTPATVSFTQSTYTDSTPVAVGANATIMLTLQNTGTAASPNLPATVQTTGNTEFVYLAGGTCVLGSPLAGSSTCTILVQFRPASYGAKSDALAIDVTGAISAALAATGTQTFTLTVSNVGASGSDEITSSPAGIACGPSFTNCSTTYTVTTTPPSVSLSASTLDAHSRFVAFSGDCTGTTCSLSITKSETVTATWQSTFVASVTVVGSGSVTSMSSPAFNCTSGTCQLTFDTGTNIGLSETPNSPVLFSGWSGGCTGVGACTLSSSAPNVTATFACPAIGSTAYVDHTNGVDDTAHGGAGGSCAFKTLNFALAHATGLISLVGSDTFPGGVSGEQVVVTLTGTQGLKCNGATLSVPVLAYNPIVDFTGTANSVNGCVLDGLNTGGQSNAEYGVRITTSGSGVGHSIVANTMRNSYYGVYLASGVTGVSIQSNTLSGHSYGIDFQGSNGATVTGNDIVELSGGGVEDIACVGGTNPSVTGSGNYHSTTGTSPSCAGCAGCPFH